MKDNMGSDNLAFPLVSAVLGLPDLNLGCNECQGWLPAYVDAEVGNTSDTSPYHEVKRHLLLCASCMDIYLTLLELALVGEEGHLPDPSHYPEPDLSFLPVVGSKSRKGNWLRGEDSDE